MLVLRIVLHPLHDGTLLRGSGPPCRWLPASHRVGNPPLAATLLGLRLPFGWTARRVRRGHRSVITSMPQSGVLGEAYQRHSSTEASLDDVTSKCTCAASYVVW